MSYNPLCVGTKIKLGIDLLVKGFDRSQLSQAFYGLIADKRQGQLLLECASFDDVDEHYNPGDEMDRMETEEMILEAVRVRQFSRTASTMAALQRVLNRVMADKGLTVADAIIGKPKKTGMFASVTVQFPVSDGQTISIVFHSPEGSNMKITGEDEIIAFRWLLNKRDITVAVSPEGEKDVSLEEVGKRVSQLVEKNSQRFQTQQKALVESKKALDELKTTVAGKQAENATLLSSLTDEQAIMGSMETKITGAKTQLEKTREYNDGLQSQLDALRAQNAANAGKAAGIDTTGGQTQAEKDAAEFEAKKAGFEQELKGRGFSAKTYDSTGVTVMLLDAGSGSIETRIIADAGFVIRVDGPDNTQGVKEFESRTLAGLDKQITAALAWIDKKLAAMKKAEPPAELGTQKVLDGKYLVDPVEHEAWNLPVEVVKEMDRHSELEPIMQTLEEENYHTENVILLAKRDGTAQDVADAEQIKGIVDKDGSVSPAVSKWQKALENWIKGTGSQEDLDAAKRAALGEAAALPAVPGAVQVLDDILSGAYASSQEISDALDQAATDLEAAGLIEQYDAKLNEAADYLTSVLQKEAGGM